MSKPFFSDLHARFDASGVRAMFAPRKPRHPLLRIALGLIGVAVLGLLLVVGLFVGTAMILLGLTRRLLMRSPAAPARDPRVVDAEYRVVRDRNPLLR